MNTSLHPITSFRTLDNCSSYVCSKKARCPSLIFLWLLLQFFVCSKTCHLHQSFSPEREGFSQGWATFYTFFTLHLPAIKKRKKEKQNCLCACFRGKRVGGKPWANFIMKSAEGELSMSGNNRWWQWRGSWQACAGVLQREGKEETQNKRELTQWNTSVWAHILGAISCLLCCFSFCYHLT